MTLSLTTRAGVGRALTWAEADANWTAIQSAVNAALAASPGVGIASITQPTPSTVQITLTNATTATFTLPVVSFNYRGSWAASTAYAVNDTFQINGALYLVLVAHTSATSFSAGANDGAGHDYYQALLSSPANSLPAGGTARQALTKIDGTDFNTQWASLRELPSGGASGQVVGYGGSSGVGAWATLPNGVPSGGAAGQFLSYGGAAGTATWAVPTLSGLADVNIAEGAAIDGFGIAWNNATSKWIAAGPLPLGALAASGATAVGPASSVWEGTPTGACTLNAATVGLNHILTVIVTTAGTTSYNVTFGTNFKSAGVIATGATSGKVWTATFVGDGTTYVEISRAGPL